MSRLAEECKGRRLGMTSDGNATSGTKARSEETGTKLGLEAPEASPSRDSDSLYAPLQDKVHNTHNLLTICQQIT